MRAAVAKSINAAAARDLAAAQEVFREEEQIDAEEVQIEREAINLLALHQPAGSDLRTVFAIVKVNADLERIADCAVNIAQQVGSLAADGVELARDVRIMAEAVLKQLDETLRALESKDATVAEQVVRSDDLLDALYNQLLQELQTEMAADASKVRGHLAMIMMARNFERIGDHCTNIAEDVLYRMMGKIVRHTHDPR